MILEGVTFLAGFSARAQAYAQAMRRTGLEPANVILFGDPAKDQPRDAGLPPARTEEIEVPLPDLAETLRDTCTRAAWPTQAVETDDVNDPAILAAVLETQPRLVVYAATRGQILSRKILGAGFPVLHMHAGWLPDYRGSTTIYYSILEEQTCAVTAFYMDPEIDTGDIVRRDRYPPPPAGTDIDYLYDGALRAETLIRTLAEYRNAGGPPASAPQPDGGTTYYVIHPLLKHLSLLSLK